MSITDEQRRREAQRLLLAEILREQAQTPAQPLTDPAQRRAAQQRTIAQNLGPRPQAQSAGMNSQTREFFERQRLLNAGVQQQNQTAPPQFDPSADDRIARKLNAIAQRSDISVSQVNGAIEIRTRGRMRDEVIRAITSPRTVSSATARYR
jgi:hypothetical protein